MNAEDRREFDRINLSRPCKIFDQRSGKYIAGSTINISHGGAMVQLSRPADLGPGDRLYIGLALTRRQTLLPANEMMDCEVVRAVRTATPATALALKFALPVEPALPLRAAA